MQVAIFEFRRTSFDASGTPIRHTVTVYPADRNRFEMEAGEVRQYLIDPFVGKEASL